MRVTRGVGRSPFARRPASLPHARLAPRSFRPIVRARRAIAPRIAKSGRGLLKYD